MTISGTGIGRSGATIFLFLGLATCLVSASRGLASPAVVINEVMASNQKTLADPQGEFDDWIELYNPGPGLVDVGGMYLTDDAAAPKKWRIPTDSVRTTMIRPQGHLLIWADGDIQDTGLHASFRLDADGDDVCLYDADGVTLLDRLVFDRQTPDVSYGRYPDGGQTLQFFGVPTPGQANSEGFQGEVAPVQFSHVQGSYDQPFDVALRTDTADAQILYTTNGQAPNESGYRAWPGRPYSGPIHIGATTCLRAMAIKPGWKPTLVYTHTYLIDSRTQLRTLPLVSLAGDAGKVFYEPNGVMAMVGGYYSGGVWTPSGAGSYNNILNRDLERPVSAEWFFPTDDAGFQIDCGLRVHGSSWMRPRYLRQNGLWSGDGKISFRLYFRGDYGQSRLEYPLIPMSEAEEFATVILRAGHNDRTNPFIKDELLRRLHQDMGQAACLGTFANLLINGEYKGFYNPTEQLREETCQEWFDSDKPWDVIAMDGVRDGDSVSWNAMLSYARTHNLADPVYYAEMCKKIDVVSLADFLIIRLWPNDWDWPQNNWAAACERSPAAQWKFFVWDAEGTFESGQIQASRFGELNGGGSAPSVLYRALKASPDFRLLFADRLYKHFNNGGALTDGNIRRRFLELRETLRSVIPSMSTYIIDTWTPGRRSIFFNLCVQEGVYTFGGPTFFINDTPFYGGQVSAGDRLSLTPTERSGKIYYTLDGSDPAQTDLQRLPVTTILVTRDAPKHFLVPTEPVSDNWRGLRPFDDSSWPVSSGGPGGLGFGRASGFNPYISADLSGPMFRINSSCYIRFPFRVEGDKNRFSTLTLKVQYDDGFVAYLNGTEVARRNFVGEPAWNSTAASSRNNTDAVLSESINLSSQVGKLQQGDNILAIQGLNSSATDNDFLVGAELLAVAVPAGSGPVGPQGYAGPVTLTGTTRVKARVQNGTTWSALAEAVFAVGPVKDSLRVSEIMYHPADTGVPGDPNAEYVELTNVGGQAIDLSFVRFTRGVHYTFPPVQLAPQAFCLVVKDRTVFETRYGTGLPVLGEYTGSLADSGERIELQDAAGAIIHAFRYEDNWLRETDGLGFSLTIRYPASTPITAWGTPGAWRPSVAPGGSPGRDDSAAIPPDGAVVIDELLANPVSGASDWVELHNTTAQPISLGGWFLSDDADQLTKYEMAVGTVLAPYGYLVLKEDQHFGNPADPGCHEPFGFSRAGESVYLCSGALGTLTGYREQAKFGASESGVTFGRYVDGGGRAHLVPLGTPSPGAVNAAPAVGPIIISGVMYHADGLGDVEYVELVNTSDTEVTLYDQTRHVPWRFGSGRDRLGGGIELLFPSDPPVSVAAHTYLLLTKDRVLFLNRFTVPADIPVLEWGMGSLSNAGDMLELCRPGDPDKGEQIWIVVDRVAFSDGSHRADFPAGQDPWSAQADGLGLALIRILMDGWGDDPLSWQGDAPSAGVVRPRGIVR